MRPYSVRLVAAAALASLVGVAPMLDAHLRAVGLLLRSLSTGTGGAEGLAELGRRPVTEEISRAPGVGRVRWYQPSVPAAAPPLLVVHGVHPEGIDEARLRSFARAMAEAGVLVATPEVTPLTRFRIDRRAIRIIGRAAAHLADRSGRPRVGVLGISFAGGLALIAAGSSEHREAIGYVVALGAHHDVARIARWYVGQEIYGPDGERPPVAPHPYGAGVLLENHLDRFLPPKDVAAARRVLRASLLGREDASERRMRALSPEGRRALSRILDRRKDDAVGDELLDALREDRRRVRAVSPAGRLAGVRVPVYLVHGTGDPIVPSTETRWLAKELSDDVLEAAMVTPLFRHAELEGTPPLSDQLALVHVIARILREGESLPRTGPVDLPTGRPRR